MRKYLSKFWKEFKKRIRGNAAKDVESYFRDGYFEEVPYQPSEREKKEA